MNQLFWSLPVVAMAALCGCRRPPHQYRPTDEFLKSDRFAIPKEFQRGTATQSEVNDWVCSLLGKNPLKSVRTDIDQDGKAELFVSQPRWHGTGGNTYLVFREGDRGFKYLGRLFFGSLRPLPPDSMGRARVLTSGWMGGGKCLVEIQTLQSEGFKQTSVRALPCGDGAADVEGGRMVEQLFDPRASPMELLRAVFGVE